ncbi:MAG: hypothetical protein BroJett021_51360 [Chloroflexota bacterium]|nr:hypothetical protein [Caldilinea sp.]GIK76148.1 MAG: hypothetical protein BroJett021_51360 [Chloroflexota bacterium]
MWQCGDPSLAGLRATRLAQFTPAPGIQLPEQVATWLPRYTEPPVLAFVIALLAVVIVSMIGAFSAAYFRQAPLPIDPLQQLTLIANDRIGWTAQAIIFPLAFLITAILFGVIAARLPDAAPRWQQYLRCYSHVTPQLYVGPQFNARSKRRLEQEASLRS